MDARFLINDGQHRKAAILEALEEDKTLGNETISIVFFEDKGLERSQQIFTDLNKNAVKTSKSIAELYDSRDPLAVATRNTIKHIEFLDTYTDKERDNLGKYSSKLFTLNNFYTANRIIFGKKDLIEKDEKFLQRFWELVTENMTPWNDIENKEISKKELRENYIATQGVVIQALGRVGHHFYEHQELSMEQYMPLLKKVNWKRSSKKWKLRAIRENGRIITNKKAILLIGNVIKKKLGFNLSEDEQLAEEKFYNAMMSN